ncbi:MAG: DUF1801 domain-containing protein [Ferruginibacter sp.]
MAKTTKSTVAASIDEYIASFPEPTRKILETVRATIKKAAPEAGEAIKYDIPTFTLHGNLISFGAWKNHFGLYPAPREVAAFKKELAAYDGAKGTVKFPSDKPVPLALIEKIVKFRVQENTQKIVVGKTLKTCLKGHKYYKSSDCPTCPLCEKVRKPQQGFLSLLSAPARRALENKGISTLQQLSKFSEKEILELHGMGPASMPKLREALKAEALTFKNP